MRNSNRGSILGVDSGGTFTDLVATDGDGSVRFVKIPSTPADPALAVEEAVRRASTDHNGRRVIHGTTVTTNAVLERRGATVALLTTAGFEDVPFIQRINRRYAYRLDWEKPSPLVKRRHVIGVRERIDASGRPLEALTESECDRVTHLVADLVEDGEAEAVAICLLFSYVDDSHERMLADRIRAACPDLPVSVSAVISPVWREYERVSTTLADAYVRPIMSGYLARLTDSDALGGDDSPLFVLKSSGGTGSPASIVPRPVTTLLSGLAGGVVGGAYFGTRSSEARCITFDMGGTSTDIGVIDDGAVAQLLDYELEWGLPVVMPAVDVHTIGAGGGSLVHMDRGGLIRVGPGSAGAVPGPACYAQGGEQPTVTDANVVLGRLNPAYFLGGTIQLDAPAAARVFEQLGAELGVPSSREAAVAALRIANENMANAIRLVTIERGIDPRDYALVAFGGAGPLHACGVARAVGIRRIVIPPHPGLCSAFGAAIANPRVDSVWSVGLRTDHASAGAVRAQFEAGDSAARRELERDGLVGEARSTWSLSCRYDGQNYEQEIPVPDLEEGFLERVAGRFHDLHEESYGYAFRSEPVELVHAKVTIEEVRGLDLWESAHEQEDAAEIIDERQTIDDDGTPVATRVLRRGRLAEPCLGPVLIEEADSTVYIPAGWRVGSGRSGCLVVEDRQ